MTSALAGADSVEHGAYLDNQALDAMRQAGAVWVPTLSTVGNLRGRGRFAETAELRLSDTARLCKARALAETPAVFRIRSF